MDSRQYITNISIPLSTIALIVKPILLVIIIVYAIMSFYNTWMIPLFFIVVCFFIWLQFFCGKDAYSYILTEKGFCIERVKKNGKNKKVQIFNKNELLMLTKSRSDALNKYIKDGKKVFMNDYTSRQDSTKEYVLVCEKENKISMILLELNEDILDGFGELFPSIIELNIVSRINTEEVTKMP